MKETIKKLKIDIKKLQHLIFTQGKKISQLSSLIDYDFLTGLYNRQGFLRETKRFFDELKNRKTKEKRKYTLKKVSLIFIDLDNLKIINDEYGHKFGDNLIKTAAKIFKESVREIDIISRWGGDEFIIALINAGEKESLMIAKKIKRKLRLTDINGLKLNASFGIISTVKSNKLTIPDLYGLIEKADLTMYNAKKDREKNSIAIYQS